ncbi:MAG: dihydroorotate dehydrogenase [Planctomycetes bacterium]|nr:dihydroorotate dehydrogenase [Planctomycetota bacterium]
MPEPAAVDLTIAVPAAGGRGKALHFAHPILPASGTFGYGEEFEPFLAPGTFAAVLGKSISLEPRAGNPPPRTFETPAGLLNSIGLQNPGLDRFLESYLPRLARYGVPVIVNLVGRTVEDYCELATRLGAERAVSAFELNISCPNVSEGLRFGLDPEATRSLVRAVRGCTDLPILAKLTPNVTDIVEQALAAEEGGADMVTLINTLRGMAIDWRTRTSRLGAASGGLSGPAIRPIALCMVHEAAKALRIPVCGIGGITAPEHVLEFMVAGASLVQVGTHLYREPACVLEWIERLRQLLAEAGIQRIRDLVGTFKPPAAVREAIAE